MWNTEPRAVAFLLGVVFLASPVVAVPPDFSWLAQATKLPPPAGQVIRVASVEELFEAARRIRPDGTILVADGHYMMPRYFELSTDRVTLRGASGDRDKVILDGAKSRHGELVGLRACSGVTIADLTIQNIRYNGFKLNSNTGVHRVTIRNCVIHNIWQRGVKGVRVPRNDPQVKPPRDCRIEHCLFYNDRPKTFEDDPASRLKRLIRLVHDNGGLAVVNNLLSGPPMRVQTPSPVRFEGNLTRDGTEWFVDVAKGDLHRNGKLPAEAGQVASIPQVTEDFDREPRRKLTGVGADQRR